MKQRRRNDLYDWLTLAELVVIKAAWTTECLAKRLRRIQGSIHERAQRVPLKEDRQ